MQKPMQPTPPPPRSSFSQAITPSISAATASRSSAIASLIASSGSSEVLPS